MAAPEVEICNAALVMLGDRPIATLAGAGVSQIACTNLYAPTVNDLLGRYRWRFASRMVKLERVDHDPLSRFNSTFQVPTGSHTVHSIRVRDTNIEYDRFEQHIYCDASLDDELIAEVMFVPSELYWPPYFRTLVELQLAAVLAFPITEDSQKASFYEGKALRQFGAAKTIDAQSRTARKIRTTGLRRYHGGRA